MNFEKIVVFCSDNWGNCEFFCKKNVLGCLIRICYFKNQKLFYLGGEWKLGLIVCILNIHVAW